MLRAPKLLLCGFVVNLVDIYTFFSVDTATVLPILLLLLLRFTFFLRNIPLSPSFSGINPLLLEQQAIGNCEKMRANSLYANLHL